MKINKRLLPAGLVAAVLLLGVPALAVAAVWCDKGVPITKFVEFAGFGGEFFETTSGNGMNCEVRAVYTTEGGSTGKVTKFEIKKCPTGFGSFKGCELATAEAKGLPWAVHVNATDLTITNLRTRRTFKAGCPTAELDKTIANVTVGLNTPGAISEMEFSGSTVGYKVIGSLEVEGANKGTYGIF